MYRRTPPRGSSVFVLNVAGLRFFFCFSCLLAYFIACLHSLNKSDAGINIFRKVISRRRYFYIPTNELLSLSIINSSFSWGRLICVINMFTLEYFNCSLIVRLFVLCLYVSTFSIFRFLRPRGFQLWTLGTPMWLPWLPFAASLACLMHLAYL